MLCCFGLCSKRAHLFPPILIGVLSLVLIGCGNTSSIGEPELNNDFLAGTIEKPGASEELQIVPTQASPDYLSDKSLIPIDNTVDVDTALTIEQVGTNQSEELPIENITVITAGIQSDEESIGEVVDTPTIVSPEGNTVIDKNQRDPILSMPSSSFSNQDLSSFNTQTEVSVSVVSDETIVLQTSLQPLKSSVISKDEDDAVAIETSSLTPLEETTEYIRTASTASIIESDYPRIADSTAIVLENARDEIPDTKADSVNVSKTVMCDDIADIAFQSKIIADPMVPGKEIAETADLSNAEDIQPKYEPNILLERQKTISLELVHQPADPINPDVSSGEHKVVPLLTQADSTGLSISIESSDQKNVVFVDSSSHEREAISESFINMVPAMQSVAIVDSSNVVTEDSEIPIEINEPSLDNKNPQNGERDEILSVSPSIVNESTGRILSSSLTYFFIFVISVPLLLLIIWRRGHRSKPDPIPSVDQTPSASPIKTVQMTQQYLCADEGSSIPHIIPEDSIHSGDISLQSNSHGLWIRIETQNETDTKIKQSLAPTLPENPIEDQEELYSVRIEEDTQPTKEYPIPTIPQYNEVVSGFMHWIPQGKQIELNGYTISSGMLYIGSKVRGAVDPSFINTRKTATSFSDYHVRLMGYWPSYSEISGDARGAYLAWLAQGKNDPNTDPGYVFLYFYGLERRILIDYPDGMVGVDEVHQIRCEVERLLSVYGENSASIRSYFSGFINLLLVLEAEKNRLYQIPIPMMYDDGEIPFYLKTYLGQCANDGIPMSPDAAYLWVMHDTCITKRTPVMRCGKEFKALFSLKYQAMFGQGIQLPNNNARLHVSYHPASSSLADVQSKFKFWKELPDVTEIPAIKRKLQMLVDKCTVELDRFSRYVGKNGDVDLHKRSLTFLPFELIASIKENSLSIIQQLLLEKGSIVMSVPDVLQEVLREERPSKEALQSLAKTLEFKGIGMEPDVIAYLYDLSAKDSILLFPLTASIPENRMEGNYLLNVLVVELAVAVARSDGSIDESESEAIHQHILTLQGVSEYQLMRLRRHHEFLQHVSLQESFIKKKLKAVPPSDIAKLLASVNHVVLADGVIDSTEIQFLERLYRYLNINSSELYHHIQNPTEIIRTDGSDANGAIDFDRVDSLKKESAELSSILSEIFKDDESEQSLEANTETTVNNDEHNPLDLDDTQLVFFTHILSRSTWTRAELQNLANEHKLMLDGILELINENALEKFGIPATEGDDTIEISDELKRRVT